MKKAALGILFLLLTVSFGYAQGQGEVRGYYGNLYGFNSNLFGQTLGGEYFVIDRVSVAPAIGIFFPATGKASNLEIDARYYVLDQTHQVYGTFGLNYRRRRLEFALPENELVTNTGINIGVGYGYKVSEEFILGSEIKYQPHVNDTMLRIGLFYLIN
ncbi:hypothetical protein KIH41_05410 [Litoribacter ruber]|uniref:Outer membrane beta-barrel protein n=1 Tax=Litoribacter ruber TaxID=702568 RepID=A0AAP2CGH9_9BACT|nr:MULTISPECIES: hypothetical protein [Litoribacter]MBS9523124.1 hypothetical protein [Litoribacter alkaliphilus]MBT0810713.1 hypothetical protein [Litoribacter ruber]